MKFLYLYDWTNSWIWFENPREFVETRKLVMIWFVASFPNCLLGGFENSQPGYVTSFNLHGIPYKLACLKYWNTNKESPRSISLTASTMLQLYSSLYWPGSQVPPEFWVAKFWRKFLISIEHYQHNLKAFRAPRQESTVHTIQPYYSWESKLLFSVCTIYMYKATDKWVLGGAEAPQTFLCKEYIIN